MGGGEGSSPIVPFLLYLPSSHFTKNTFPLFFIPLFHPLHSDFKAIDSLHSEGLAAPKFLMEMKIERKGRENGAIRS